MTENEDKARKSTIVRIKGFLSQIPEDERRRVVEKILEDLSAEERQDGEKGHVVLCEINTARGVVKNQK